MANTGVNPQLHASFPPELILAIMEEVYSSMSRESKPALAACSLTCREWNACSQHFYFRDITIDSEQKLERFLALLDSSPWINNAVMNITLMDFANLWTSPYRPASSLEREVAPRSTTDVIDLKPYSGPLRRALFTTFPHKLQDLKTITLIGYTDVVENFNSDALQALSRLASVTKVTFDSCSVAPIVIPFIASTLSGLEELQVIDNNFSLDSSQDVLKSIAGPGPSLRALSAYAGPYHRDDISFSWIISSPSRHTLRSLSIMFEIDSPEPFGLLLREVGPYLEHLSFEVEGTPGTHSIATDLYKEHIDLSLLTRLKSLVIRANVRSKLLYHFLPQISSECLSLLVIVMSNIRWYKKHFSKHSFSDLVKQSPYFHNGRTRIVFANDPLSPSAVADISDSDEELEGIQTVDVLKAYLEKVLSVSQPSVQYEVMSFPEASKLTTARPIDM